MRITSAFRIHRYRSRCAFLAAALSVAAANAQDAGPALLAGQPTPATRPMPLGVAPSRAADEPRIASLRSMGTQAAPSIPTNADVTRLLTAAFERTQQATTLDDYNAIIETCESALKQNLAAESAAYARRLAAWAYNRRGEIYAQQATEHLATGDREKAIDLDLLALEDFKASVAYDPGKWKSLHNRGVSQALQGRLKEAISDFDEVLKLKPDYANAWFNRGEIRLQIGAYEKAIEDYTRSLELNPNDPGALQGRAQAHAKLGDHARALADLNAVLAAKPTHAPALTDRGEVYAALGQWEQAADDFRAAAKADPKFGRAYRGLAWLLATCPDERQRNAEAALVTAEKAMEFDGEDYQTLDTLAAAYANAQRYAEAKSTLEKAIELAPAFDAEAMKERLQLYASERPYRDAPRTARRETPVLR
jgi:tetratricopeptide (TPR) repeat protein